MSTGISALLSSIRRVRDRVFRYETSLKGRLIALNREAYNDVGNWTNQSLFIDELRTCGQEDAHDEIRDELRSIIARVEEFAEATSTMEANVKEQKETANTLRSENLRKAATIKTLREKLTGKELLLTQCQSEKHELDVAMTTTSNNLRDAQKQLQAHAKTIGGLQEQIKELEEDLAVSKCDVDILEPEQGDLKSTAASSNNEATEKMEQLLGQYAEIRQKDVEGATAVQTLLSALTRSHEQLDVQAVEIAELKAKKEPQVHKEDADTLRHELQELQALAADQALENKGLRGRLLRMSGGRRGYQIGRRFAIASPTSSVRSEDQEAVVPLLAKHQGSEDSEAASVAGTEWHDASQVTELGDEEELTQLKG